ncbi:TFIIB zinc-binding [Fragilaria crotonensis]|nr:TFIIB zinc-binding [Fragilaria crotonensis]
MAAAYNFGNSQNNNHNRNYIHQSSQSARAIDDEDDDRVCRSCHSHNLRVDWAQGDRVCTDCGVVDESHILDDRPEWKDFGEAEDLVKGLPSGARSGLVVVDESKYLGGLQPTILSKHVYGNCPMASATTNIRKSLNATNRKMDRYMEKEQKRALQRAKLSLALKRKQIDVGEESDVRPEHDAMLLHEEQESERAYSALFREKWSLQRALLLHGHDLDESASPSSSSSSLLEERAELVARLDKTLKRASYDLYTAYTILQHAAQRLNWHRESCTRRQTHCVDMRHKKMD